MSNTDENKNYKDILVQYKILNKESKHRILGKIFVEKNKNLAKIILNGKGHDILKENIEDIIDLDKEDYIKLIIRIYDDITDFSFMFSECNALESFPDEKSNEQNEINYNFNNSEEENTQNENSINKTVDIKKENSLALLNTVKVTSMKYMFYKCESLISLPDISKWNTDNMTDISYMFYGCKSLKSLPDISKWKTKNVTDISRIFYDCEYLNQLPDISKWKTNNIVNMEFIFLNALY